MHRMLIKFTDVGVMKSTSMLLFADGKAKLSQSMVLSLRRGGGGSEGIFPLILTSALDGVRGQLHTPTAFVMG